MSEENNEKLENGKKILNEIKSIKNLYKVETTDHQEEEFSFLDRVSNLVKLILDDSSTDVYETLSQDRLEGWKKRKLSRWIKKTFANNFRNTLYFVLLCTITGFLVSEAVNFYAIDGVADTKTWIKAILTEVCFIFLSGYKARGKMQVAWVGFLRAGIFALMMFVISSQTLTTGTKTISENTAIQEQIELIQEQIKEKEKSIIYYRDVKNWPISTKQVIKEKNKLVDKLLALKAEQASGKNNDVSVIETYKMYGRAAFRVLLLFISVLITRRIFTF